MVIMIILFYILIFTGVIFFIFHAMLGHVGGAVNHLKILNEEMLKQQAELKAKMTESEKEYQAKMAAAQQELSQSQLKAREESVKVIDEARARALSEREKIIQDAVQTRDKMRNEIMADMEQKAIGYSKDVVSEFFTGDLGKLMHATLVRETTEGLQEMDVAQFQVAGGEASFKTAYPLTSQERIAIQKVLKEKIQKEVTLKEETDATLVAGFVMQFGNFVIDGSLINSLAEAAARLKREAARKYQGSV